MAQQPRLTLSDANSIPQLGFGLWQVPNDDAPAAIAEAIKVGYRSIDSAQGYQNEAGVGDAIRQTDVPRSELFITSKLTNSKHAYDDALKSFDVTMEKLGVDQLDLFLIHWPRPMHDQYVEAWKALVKLQADGRIKSIGVSNFNPDHLDRIIGETGVTPVVNQIELHPGFQQRGVRAFHQKHGIAIESWSPLGSGQWLKDPTIAAIGKKYGKTVAQTIIRWHLEQGLIVIPKSVTPSRIAQNFDVFDFTLDSDDMAKIAALDSPSGRIGGDPATADYR